jgi:NADH-quinone oxidoreductase subunit C
MSDTGAGLGTTDAEVKLNPIVERLRSWDPAAIADVIEWLGELTMVVPREQLRHVCTYLRDEPGLEFNFLSDVSAQDRFPLEPRFDVNYHLLSISNRQALRLRVRLESADARVDSITNIWPTAEWHEREVFDLFGIRFNGHPDLRRIMMPEDWEGHPLRKEFPVEGFR